MTNKIAIVIGSSCGLGCNTAFVLAQKLCHSKAKQATEVVNQIEENSSLYNLILGLLSQSMILL